MKVLHVAQPVEAGVAVVVRQLARHQVHLGWKVAVACPSDGSLPAWIRACGATVFRWSAKRAPGPSTVSETLSLRKIIRNWGPDLVHLHSSKAGLVGRLAIRGRLPTVYQPHAWSFLAVKGPMRALSLGWERAATRWTDDIVCVSDAEMAIGTAMSIRSSWSVCPNGIDLGYFHPPTPQEQTEARRRLGWTDDPLVVCVGRLCEQKGQDALLHAWVRVRADADAVLVLVGDGSSRASLEDLAGERVVFVGNAADVLPWYHAASVVVQPSRWEAGASLTLREAMACGLSVVATDVVGVREVVSERCGAVVPVDDSAALATALVERLLNPARRADEGSEGRRIAERTLDQTVTLRAVDTVYRRVVRPLKARRPRSA